jgi:glycosyltransferase involved in cell wall biosynthesis
MMNILLLAPQPFFQNRGTPIAVRLLSEVLTKAGHRICLLIYHEGKNVEIPNVTIHRIPSIPGLRDIRPGFSFKKIICDIMMLCMCFKIVCKTRFDLVHAVEESVFIAMLLRLFFRIPFVYDMDSSLSRQMTDKHRILLPIRGVMESIEKMAAKYSSGIVVVCKSLEKIARKYAPNNLLVRLEDISLLDGEPRECEKLYNTLEISGAIIMYVGNLEKYQGIDLLLDSFKLVLEKFADAHLVIIGGSVEDITAYKDLSCQLGINSNVRFVGQKPVSQLGSYLSQADVLVSPRIQGENTPMKIYSYLDSGRPLLATYLPTHTQVLDNQIALLVQPEPKAMADGIISLIEDIDLATALAFRAKERVKQEYSFKAFQKKLLGFYKSLEKSAICDLPRYI